MITYIIALSVFGILVLTLLVVAIVYIHKKLLPDNFRTDNEQLCIVCHCVTTTRPSRKCKKCEPKDESLPVV